jgi:hypothetical protein
MTPMMRAALAALLLVSLPACNRDLVCAADQQECGDQCVSVEVDARNCGACGAACGAGEACVAGQCVCPATACGGACVDLTSDPAHCGTCDAACAPGTVCTTGGGGATACAAACALTSQTLCGRACVDLQANAYHCGACGRACGSSEHCAAGRCVSDLYLACFNTGELRGATAALDPSGIPLRVPPGPIGLAWAGDDLFVASAARGGAETLWATRFDPPGTRVASVLKTDVKQPDVQYLAEHGGLLYLSHSSIGTLLVATPEGRIVDEIGLAPTASNPHGIAFVGDEAYVALNETGEIVVLDVSSEPACAAGATAPPCARELARIDLAPLATAGALPRPSRILATHGRVFVTLWNLDASFGLPSDPTGRVAVIDPGTHEVDPAVKAGDVAGLIDLGSDCLNTAELAVQGDTLYVSCGAFDYSAFPEVKIIGAGVATIDVSGSTPVAGAILPSAPGAAPGKLAFCKGAGYVGDRNTGRVFRLDPATGALDGAELCPPSGGFAYVADLACGP